MERNKNARKSDSISKFKVLEYNQNWMSRFGIHSHNLTGSNNEFYKSFGAFYILIFDIGFLILSSGVFIYKNYSNFELIFEPCLIAIAGIQSTGMFLSVGLKLKQVKALQLKFQEITDNASTAQSDKIINIYQNVEKKCLRYTKRISIYIYMDQIMFVVSICLSIYSILLGNIDTASWDLPYRLSVPFSTKSIWGWLLMWFCQSNLAMSYSLAMVSVTSHFVCCCLYTNAICDHFNYLINLLNEEIDLNRTEKYPKKYKKRCQIIKKTFSVAVELHNNITQ